MNNKYYWLNKVGCNIIQCISCLFQSVSRYHSFSVNPSFLVNSLQYTLKWLWCKWKTWTICFTVPFPTTHHVNTKNTMNIQIRSSIWSVCKYQKISLASTKCTYLREEFVYSIWIFCNYLLLKRYCILINCKESRSFYQVLLKIKITRYSNSPSSLTYQYTKEGIFKPGVVGTPKC